MEVCMKTKNGRMVILALVIIMAVGMTACNKTSFDGMLNIVEPTMISDVYLSEGNHVIIDARGMEAYEKGHLKNAVCLPPSELVVDKPVKNLIAPKAKVDRKLSALGIKNDTVIYVYDDNGGVSASRIWWTLKAYGHENIQVINGGASGLAGLGLEMTKAVPEMVASEYDAKEMDPNMVIDFETLKGITEDEDSKVKIVDVRSISEYEAGMIPGAIFYPHSNNLYTDGTFMSARDIKLFYTDKGIQVDDEIILYCKSSFRATQTLLVLEEAGYNNVKIYDGAWLEWTANGGSSDGMTEKAPITVQDGS